MTEDTTTSSSQPTHHTNNRHDRRAAQSRASAAEATVGDQVDVAAVGLHPRIVVGDGQPVCKTQIVARAWGFAESGAEVEHRQTEAASIVGEQLVEVRYYTLDYERDRLRPGLTGLHWITAEAEWHEPTWQTPRCDSLDYGVELLTQTGRLFSITWDPPGWREGMGISETPFAETVLRPNADVAVWRVTSQPDWARLLRSPVTAVDLNFIPWGQSTDDYWCTRITISLGDGTVIMMLGEGTTDGQIEPSADNIAVLFDKAHLPTWELRAPTD